MGIPGCPGAKSLDLFAILQYNPPSGGRGDGTSSLAFDPFEDTATLRIL
jgi:hypothetical protein